MNKKAPVSVVIPVYNTGKYLQAALDCIFNQTLKNIEIICVNDGSTDDSAAILERNKDRISTIVNQPNGGLSSARNSGMAKATGEYIYFFDSDDLLVPEALAELYEAACKDNLDVIEFEWVRFFDTPDQKAFFNGRVDSPKNGVYNGVYRGSDLFAEKIRNNDFMASACLRFMRKSFLDKLNHRFLEGILHEDELFSVICDVNAERVKHIPHKYFKRRVREGSIMTVNTLEDAHAADRLTVVANLLEYFSSEEIKSDAYDAVRRRLSDILDAALWSYIRLPDSDRKNLPARFHKNTSLICELFIHICNYANSQNGSQLSELKTILEEYKTKIFSLESDLARTVKMVNPTFQKQDSKFDYSNVTGSGTAISVIIPVYNMEDYLGDCFSSVLSQTLRNIEIICVDDGSNDKSWEILSAYAEKDSRIRLFQQSNQGVAAARNRGIIEAVGQYLAFMDPDDFYPDSFSLENMYTAAHRNKVLICGGSVAWHENGMIQEHPQGSCREMEFEKSGLIAYSDYQYDYGFWRFIYSREFLNANKIVFPLLRRFQDPPFMAAAFSEAGVFYALKEPVYVYRANYKTMNLTQFPMRRVLDIYTGLLEVLRISKVHSLAKLHRRAFERVNVELIDIASSAIQDGNREVFSKLLELQNSLDFSLLGVPADTMLLPLRKILESSAENNKLLFSVVIPVYNTEEYLPRCIDSLKNQTYGRFEVVFVDDCSEGDSRSIIESYGDTRFRYIRHDRNRGLLAARITGSQAASGRYIVPLDSDDSFEPDLLREFAKVLEQSPETDVITYGTTLIKDGVKSNFWANIPGGTMNGGEILDSLLQSKLYWSTCGKCIRRSLYLGGIEAMRIDFDLKLNNTEDLVIFLPVAHRAGKLVAIDYAGYNYFKNSTSISGGVTESGKWGKTYTDVKNSWKYLTDYAVREGIAPKDIERIRFLQRSTIVWGLKEINHLSTADWNERFAVLHNCCYNDILYDIIFNNYMARLYDVDFTSFKFPTLKQGRIKTIGIICGVMAYGGAERAAARLIYHFMEAGYKVVLFNSHDPSPDDYDYPSIPRFTLPVNDYLARWQSLQSKCFECEVDCAVVVDHLPVVSYFDILCLRQTGVKIVMQEHNAYHFPLINSPFASRFFYRKSFYRLADAVTCLSELNRTWWHTSGFEKTVYLPNFLTFSPEDTCVSQLESKKLVFAGRMTAIKGIFEALEMVAVLRERHPDVKLYMLGRFVSDDEHNKFKDFIAEHHLEDNVFHEGFVPNVGEYFKDAAAFVMCSRVEGAPMVLFESKAYGVPCVLFDMPYVDGITREEGAVTVPYGDVRAMAEALASLLNHKSELKHLGALARKSLVKFSDAVIMWKWNTLFRNLEAGSAVAEAEEKNPLLEKTMNEYEHALRDILHFIQESNSKVGHAEYLSKELSKAKSGVESLAKELQSLRGHAQYLSHELQPYESSRILRTTLRILNLLRRIKRKILN